MLLNLRVLRVQQRAKHVKRRAASLGWREMLYGSRTHGNERCRAPRISAEVTIGKGPGIEWF